jgi:hypothetical protein
MANYNLQPNESIIMKSTGIIYGNGILNSNQDELILTNLNIILVQKGVMGNTKNIQSFPVNQIKMFNGQAQVTLGKTRNLLPQLEVYFKNRQEFFGFMNKSEAVKWINNINKLLTGNTDYSDSNADSKKLMTIPGTELVATTLKDTFDTVKGVFSSNSRSSSNPTNVKVTIKCLGCGAPLSGIQGNAIRCKYCDTDQSL